MVTESPPSLHATAQVSTAVARTPQRSGKIALLTEALQSAGARWRPLVAVYLSGTLPQGRIGIGPATLRDAALTTPAAAPSLTLAEVDTALSHIAEQSGPGSASRRSAALRQLLSRTTTDERDFLIPLLLGGLRQGALEGLMAEAVAQAENLGPAAIRRALLLAGSLSEVVEASTRGADALDALTVQLFRPLKPMLAAPASSPTDALEQLGSAAFEYKLDGARVQVHKSGDDVRVYTRALNDVTDAVPEVVQQVRALPFGSGILDGETLAEDEQGRPHPFQVTMSRFGSSGEREEIRARLPLTTTFFDVLALDGRALLDEPYRERREHLLGAVGEAAVPARICTTPEDASATLDEARLAGHEGVIAKALDAPYEAGRRGSTWLKVKPTYTLDLVVLAAEWGHGRRSGWLSNLHLGARGPSGFVMLGKTFKGLTDEILRWQTAALLELEVRRTRRTVYVQPRLVVEIAFDGVQESSRYPGGVTLRFARLRGYRLDKGPEEADTVDTVRALRHPGLTG
ncbi:MAG: ATP-dependent DNA ligase [Gemmatimonadota bacterium]